MGYQESIIKFKSEDLLFSELEKYKKRDKTDDFAHVVNVLKLKNDLYPFSKGELTLVVVGERSEQRSVYTLKEGLGIDNVEDIVFIDNEHYRMLSEGDLIKFLDDNFEIVSKDYM